MSENIETLLHEERIFPPTEPFARVANVTDRSIYTEAHEDYLGFWENAAKDLDWFEPWQKTLEWNLPDVKWFVGGKLNASHNCLDRHVAAGLGGKTAIVWEGEPGDVVEMSYSELLEKVCQCANALKAMGIQKGDRVCIYLPMIPEIVVSMLACARIGAIHSVVFGGFSAESLIERITDLEAKVVITADGGWRRGNIVTLKKTVDQALSQACPTIEKVLVVERAGPAGTVAGSWTVRNYDRGNWDEGRDIWWKDVVDTQPASCPCEKMDSEDVLFVLYTSGSTGKPKGIVHSTGGYLTGVTRTANWVFDLKDNDIYWCTADCGWITGHSYVVYGMLANCATVVLYEGTPDTPTKSRFWDIVDRHGVTILYTAPTAIRTFMQWGTEHVHPSRLTSLRLLGSVGEPINPEAWMWYRENVGLDRCPIVDTWWQTETGGIMISPLPGITGTKPGSATHPFPGISICILDESGKPILEDFHGEKKVTKELGGFLAIDRPWPSMLRGIWRDPQRYMETYWSKFPGYYFAGDGVKIDSDGYLWLLGRVDDIMLVSGHNISTMEVESALVDHHAVAEAAVIGRADSVKGQAIAAFVILKQGAHADFDSDDALLSELKSHVANKIGPIARPDDIILTAELPKTRSGKIMRRLLRDIAEGRALGDVTTLADSGVVAGLREKYESQES